MPNVKYLLKLYSGQVLIMESDSSFYPFQGNAYCSVKVVIVTKAASLVGLIFANVLSMNLSL